MQQSVGTRELVYASFTKMSMLVLVSTFMVNGRMKKGSLKISNYDEIKKGAVATTPFLCVFKF